MEGSHLNHWINIPAPLDGADGRRAAASAQEGIGAKVLGR